MPENNEMTGEVVDHNSVEGSLRIKKPPPAKAGRGNEQILFSQERLEIHAQVMACQEDILSIKITHSQFSEVTNCPVTEVNGVSKVLVYLVSQTKIELPAVVVVNTRSYPVRLISQSITNTTMQGQIFGNLVVNKSNESEGTRGTNSCTDKACAHGHR